MLSKKLKAQIVRISKDSPVEIRDNGEDLVAVKGLFAEKPFWLDQSSLVQDIEGKFYREYIYAHPNFELLVRKSVLKKLQVAQSRLPKSWHIVVRAAYRPHEVQVDMFDDYVDKLRKNNPNWDIGRCTEHAEKYISNPYKLTPCPHTTGGAIDIELYDKVKRVTVDMGGDICELSVKSHCLNSELTSTQLYNQETLIMAMCEAGFAPFHTEWWHFSYGDQKWANFYGNNRAIYDNVRHSIDIENGNLSLRA